MQCVRKVTDDLYWVGANDYRTELFENVFARCAFFWKACAQGVHTDLHFMRYLWFFFLKKLSNFRYRK